MNSVAALPCEI